MENYSKSLIDKKSLVESQEIGVISLWSNCGKMLSRLLKRGLKRSSERQLRKVKTPLLATVFRHQRLYYYYCVISYAFFYSFLFFNNFDIETLPEGTTIVNMSFCANHAEKQPLFSD